MMLQHPGLGLVPGLVSGLDLVSGSSEISASTLLPCLSPPGSLTLDDFTHFSPLVKEGLRYTIQNKRLSGRMSTTWTGTGSGCSDCGSDRPPEPRGGKRELTVEELNRRKRRRERNKIAAAKCRNKKKEKRRTVLQKESEKLESLNTELKAQIEELKNQKQQLVYMLNLHRPTCIVRAHNGQTPEDERNLFIQQIKETTLQCLDFSLDGHASVSTPTACHQP
ncbi:Cyclic AMP-dependent transcription factor ATF-3 [Bagarius yarrelli]|uniref:Cyclic AMP-dependent transcription factor ATF-3 n=1 Tax=Bagarius yarrelli TaxID=175774 RepID=A0A556TZP0_BAGYA|nr:Cyclic AMP-dependent transcription factor ATF-3 [Bagarius yarrelli]